MRSAYNRLPTLYDKTEHGLTLITHLAGCGAQASCFSRVDLLKKRKPYCLYEATSLTNSELIIDSSILTKEEKD